MKEIKLKPFSLKKALAGEPVAVNEPDYKVIDLTVLKKAAPRQRIAVTVQVISDTTGRRYVHTYLVDGRGKDDAGGTFDLFMVDKPVKKLAKKKAK